MERGRPLALLVLLAALGGHLLLGTQLAEWRSRREILPPPPPQALLAAEAFGDRQARFRLLALEVQNFGDGDGRFTALRDYDYDRLLQWLALLDAFDPRSETSLALAGTLYGQTGDTHRAALMAEYLHRRAMADPVRNWHWLALAVYLARHRAHDPALALNIAVDLAGLRDPAVPDWVREMPRFVMARIEDRAAARQLVEAILASRPELEAQDRKALERLAR